MESLPVHSSCTHGDLFIYFPLLMCRSGQCLARFCFKKGPCTLKSHARTDQSDGCIRARPDERATTCRWEKLSCRKTIEIPSLGSSKQRTTREAFLIGELLRDRTMKMKITFPTVAGTIAHLVVSHLSYRALMS